MSYTGYTLLREDCDGLETFVNEHYTLLTHTGTLSAMTWREYLEENWDTFQRGLTELKLLVICGVHGGKDGSYSGDANNVNDCQRQAVSLQFYIPIFLLSKVLPSRVQLIANVYCLCKGKVT